MKKHLLSTLVLSFLSLTWCRAQGPILYGMTVQGGDLQAQGGNIFQYPLVNNVIFESVHNFGVGNGDGQSPWGSLMLASNGLMYGMTKQGGAHGQGVLFSFNPLNDTEIVWHSFNYASGDGAGPYGSLIQASNGLLYGLGTGGGAGGMGAIISFNPVTDSEQVVYSFGGGTSDGEYAYGSLIQGKDSLLYGLTQRGGLNSAGVIFSFNIADSTETKLWDFGSDSDAASPWGSLMQASDGLLYGMSYGGGRNNYGTIFSYNTGTGRDSVLHYFSLDSTDGRSPYGSLIQYNDSLLCGLALGGRKNDGLLFTYNIHSGTLNDLHDFGSIYQDGVRPEGSSLLASDGNIYGMTGTGGSITDGVIFTYKPVDSSYSYLSFTGPNGYLPYYGALIEYNALPEACLCGLTDGRTVVVYPNPTNGQFTIKSNNNSITGSSLEIYNVLGQLIYTSTITGNTWPVNLSGQAKGIYFYHIAGSNAPVQQGKISLE